MFPKIAAVDIIIGLIAAALFFIPITAAIAGAVYFLCAFDALPYLIAPMWGLLP